MIDIKDLSFHFGLRTLFEDTSVMIQDGQKVGLVGPNGCGKSTLFKLIEGKFPRRRKNRHLPRYANCIRGAGNYGSVGTAARLCFVCG